MDYTNSIDKVDQKVKLNIVLDGGIRNSHNCRNVGYHRHGVNNLIHLDANAKLSQEGKFHFLSGGRDGVINHFSTARKNQNSDSSFSPQMGETPLAFQLETHTIAHNGWINDLKLVKPLDSDHKVLIASASSDCSVKLWSYSTPETISDPEIGTTDSPQIQHLQNLHHWRGHIDFVKSIGVFPGSDKISAAGIAAPYVYLWQVGRESPAMRLSIQRRRSEEPKKYSAYTSVFSDDGNLLAVGFADGKVRIWDLRTSTIPVIKLQNHFDTVRSLLISSDGKKLYSGSSDKSIKVCEIQEQRVLESYEFHQGAVFTMNWKERDTSFSSAGRDGNLYLSDLKTKSHQKILTHKSPILSTVEDSLGVWIASASPDLQYYDLSARISQDEKVEMGSDASNPALVIPGRKDGITRASVLNDKRHVLTQDSGGHLDLYDVTKCAKVEQYPPHTDFDTCLSQLNTKSSMSSWFDIDISIIPGDLTIQLESPKCFKGQIYLSDTKFDFPELPEDTKLNYGAILLSSLFAKNQTIHNGSASIGPSTIATNGYTSPRGNSTSQDTSNTSSEGNIPSTNDNTSKGDNHTSKEENTPSAPPTNNNVSDNTSKGDNHTSKEDNYTSKEDNTPSAPPKEENTPRTIDNTSNQPSQKQVLPTQENSHNHNRSVDKDTPSNSPRSTSSSPSTNKIPPTRAQESENQNPEKDSKKVFSYTPPFLFDLPDLSFFVSVGRVDKSLCARFSAEELRQMDLDKFWMPNWLLDLLIRNQIPDTQDSFGFHLIPSKEERKLKEIPGLGTQKLTAPRLLRIAKVMQFIKDKLKIEDKHLLNSEIQVVCKGTVLTEKMPLSDVVTFYWKSSNPLILHYQLVKKELK